MSRSFLSGNKGFVFSMMAILLLALAAITLVGREKTVIQSESDAIRTRFEIANNFLTDLESNILPSLLEADTARALDAISLDINDTGTFLSSADELRVIVNDSVLNGSGLPAAIGSRRGNATMVVQLPQIKSLAKEQFRLTLSIVPSNVTILQDNSTGPSKYRATMDVVIDLDAGFATWSRKHSISTLVDIAGLHDPLILQATRGTGLLNKSEISFFDGPFSNLTLGSFIYNRSYTWETKAPSYLQRFYNDIDGSECCGIESMVCLNANMPAGTPYRRASFVDWCYWSGACDTIGQSWTFWTLEPEITSSTEGTPYYMFMMDSYHLNKYNISTYQRTSNECSCNRAVDPHQYEGSGCIGVAVNERCI